MYYFIKKKTLIQNASDSSRTKEICSRPRTNGPDNKLRVNSPHNRGELVFDQAKQNANSSQAYRFELFYICLISTSKINLRLFL